MQESIQDLTKEQKCAQEIQEVLKKYDCDLTIENKQVPVMKISSKAPPTQLPQAQPQTNTSAGQL